MHAHIIYYRECALLKANGTRVQTSLQTKATTVNASKVKTLPVDLLVNVRRISWVEIKENSTKISLIGKGTFAKCYLTQMGSMNVCIKVLSIDVKYKCLFYSEAKILSLVCHKNLPWMHAFSDDSNKVAIIMTFHCYQTGKSLNIYDALLKHSSDNRLLDSKAWRQILLGCTSALVYLQSKHILHNDIKTDNVLIESTSSGVRAILIDFNKACLSCDAKVYKLSSEEKRRYSKYHPQIAPEVRNGSQRQSFASDIYSFGRILYKVNDIALVVPCVNSLSLLCLSPVAVKRPSASELEKSLSNLFV